MLEIPAQAQSGRGTRSRQFHPSHDDHLEPKGVPDLLVRTVYEAGGVGERQDEVRRCGDACDSLVYWGEEAVVHLDHRRLVPADTDLAVAAWGTPAVAVDTDLPLEVVACREVAHEPRRWVFVQAEGIKPARPAGVALDPRFVGVDTQCGPERMPAPGTRPV